MKGFKLFNIIILIVLSLFYFPVLSQNKGGKPKVLIMEINSEINPQMNRYVKLALKKANDLKVDAVAIEMNTYGGVLNDADEIRTAILEFSKPAIVFINKNAASAGALISIACDSIYMAPGANIGAATVVTGEGTPAGGKYQSYMRSMMRSTAEATGRNPRLAEAMVDEDLAADSLRQAGKVLSLTTDEAIKFGFCQGKVSNMKDALKLAGLSDHQQVKFELSPTERIIAFFMNPFVSGILILIIIAGIYLEFQNPGMIFPIAASTVAIILYFIPYYINGLAANWEIVMFFVGVILLGAEIFAIPGFGVTGVLGIILMVGALMLSMISNKVFDFSLIQMGEILNSLLTALSGLLAGIILIIILSWRFTKSNRFLTRVALSHVQDSRQGYTSSLYKKPLVGSLGKTFTVLRPSGKIIIEDEIYDAYSRGEYIEKDVEVVVVSEEGSSLKVKRAIE